MLTIDEMQALLEEIAAELPEAFFDELNGGVQIGRASCRERVSSPV